MRYPVTLTRDDNDTYVVTFPDVPEAITYGDTKTEALERAPEALLTIFDAFMKDRREIPAPSVTRGTAIELPPLECTKLELYRAMRAEHVGKAELARRLDWHLPQVDRVLNIRHGSQLDQLDAAFRVLGKRLSITVADVEHPVREATNRTAVMARHGGRTSGSVGAYSKKAAAKKR
jgi:antitoxin HicB